MISHICNNTASGISGTYEREGAKSFMKRKNPYRFCEECYQEAVKIPDAEKNHFHKWIIHKKKLRQRIASEKEYINQATPLTTAEKVERLSNLLSVQLLNDLRLINRLSEENLSKAVNEIYSLVMERNQLEVKCKLLYRKIF